MSLPFTECTYVMIFYFICVISLFVMGVKNEKEINDLSSLICGLLSSVLFFSVFTIYKYVRVFMNSKVKRAQSRYLELF